MSQTNDYYRKYYAKNKAKYAERASKRVRCEVCSDVYEEEFFTRADNLSRHCRTQAHTRAMEYLKNESQKA